MKYHEVCFYSVMKLSEDGFLIFFLGAKFLRQNDCEGKRLKTSGSGDENLDSKAEAEPSSGKHVEQNTQTPPEPPKQDYIHVRARRGQATDSHSLAERVTSLKSSLILLFVKF